MIKLRTTNFASLFTLVVAVILVSSCGTVKKAKWSTDHILVKSAYVQKYISGQEREGEEMEEEPSEYSFLFVDIDVLDTSIVLDSALYDSRMNPTSLVRIPLKIEWIKGENYMLEELDNNQAIIYYTKGKKRYKRIVENIEFKEDFYLP